MTSANNSSDTLFGTSLLDDEQAVQEKDLVFPILLLLAEASQNKHGPVTTYQMYTAFKNTFAMSPTDNEVVRSDRNLTRFKRTLQNVFSHDLLTRDKWIERNGEGWEITPRGRAHLLDLITPLHETAPTPGQMNVVEKGDRVIEGMVAIQILSRLADLQKDNQTPVTLTQLRREVKSMLPLTVADLHPLKNRSDTRIDQVIRNVISHNTLTKDGWCTRSEKGLVITDKGKAHLLDYVLQNEKMFDFRFLVREEQEFRAQLFQRRAEVATEAASRRKMKQKA